MDPRIVRAVRREGLGPNIKDILIVCYDQILSGEIETVSELVSYVDELGWDPRLDAVVRRCYRLIRRLHWGIFKDLDAETHPELWKSLTITNPTMPDVADLKRNVVVPNVYCGLLDIHAYTEFCQRNRHNVSMLRTLDDVIQSDMREIAHKNGCLSARTAGDNILVIGSSPGNTVHACLGIIDCFSRRRVLEAAGLFEDRRGISVVMQDFTVSAGIAGGLRYSSLVVTQDGDISGTAMNTAARLQAFAAQISPDHSKVMVTSHVCSGYLKEQEKKQEYAEGFTFFNCGKIHFKGTSVSVCELLYSKQDIKKTEYQKRYTDLLEAAKSGRFSDRLISNAVQLIVDVLSTKPIPRLKLQENGSTQILTNETVVKLCKDAISRYESAQDHRTVSVELNRIVRILESASGFDPLVLTRFRQIVALYDQMTQEFETLQYEKIIENQTGLFSVKERTVIDRAERLERIRDTLIERGKRNNSIYSPLVLWNKIVSEYEGKWELDVYSGKK